MRRAKIELPVKKTLALALALTVLPDVVAVGRPRPRGGAQDSTGAVEHVGTMDHGPLEEVSGIVKSARYDDVYWVHNDGGHEARLYPIDGAGTVIVAESAEGTPGPGNSSPRDGSRPEPGIVIPATNVDWEDIALSDGRLFIADMGNNGNARRDLGVYIVDEPDPRASSMPGNLVYLPIRYPDQETFPATQWHFDCEALFVSDGTLYFLTKHQQAGRRLAAPGTKLYRLDTQHTDRDNVLTLVDVRDDLFMPTAASLSPDGTALAILTYRALWVFPKPETGDRWLTETPVKLDLPVARTRQAEAVCWEDVDTLLIANEQRDLFRVERSSLRRSD